MMEHALIIKKFDGYDQAFSIADSEIRRMINSEDDIPSMLEKLAEELDESLSKN